MSVMCNCSGCPHATNCRCRCADCARTATVLFGPGQGWLCGRCNRMNAPTVPQCPCSFALPLSPPGDFGATNACPRCGMQGMHICEPTLTAVDYWQGGGSS